MEFEKIKKIIAEVLNVDEDSITMESTFGDDLGADSLDVFQIIMGVEEEFEIEIPEECIELNVDRLQLSRVITNLINNALKHNLSGTKISLQMECIHEVEKSKPNDRKQTLIRLAVSDNGTLIPSEVAEHIFEPFVMADASRESKGGSGLGLSIAKKIVEMHGWTIELIQDFERQEKSFVINIRK